MMASERISSNIYASSESETDNGRSSTVKTNPDRTDLGKRVVFTSTNDRKKKYGTLRYIGQPEFSKGQWCGVELDEPNGKNNGSVQGIRYFNCPPDCGIFVQLSRVELDPNGDIRRSRTKTSVTSLVEKRARKLNKASNPPPFFYNTMPRSSSVSALNLCESSTGNHKPRQRSTNPLYSPQHKPTGTTSNRLSPGVVDQNQKPKKRSMSHHTHQLKKYSSEINIPMQKETTIDWINRPPGSSSRSSSTYQSIVGRNGRPITGRKPLGSYSEATLLNNNNKPRVIGSLTNSTSCHDLFKLSPSAINSRRLSKKPSPDSAFISPPPPTSNGLLDSEDGLSYYSSTSDLSHCEVSSDSDLTPRSSSGSPSFIDIETTDVPPVILNPPSPSPTSPEYPNPSTSSSNSLKTAQSSRSPTHRISLPTGLATPTSTLIESSRSSGNVGTGEYTVPSPDHQKVSKIYLNSKNGRSTLDHPLVNNNGGKPTDTTGTAGTVMVTTNNTTGTIVPENNVSSVFVCPTSGQEMTMTNPTTTAGQMDLKKLQSDVTLCLRQQADMESRLSSMEDKLIQFQSLFMKTMEQVQETLKKQMEYRDERRLHHQHDKGTWSNLT